MEEKSEILSIYNENINQMPNAKPIRLDTGLLIYLIQNVRIFKSE